MIDENSMKESNTPNMGNRIVNFYKEKPKIATIIASATALLMCALAWSIDGFLSSDDDESKRPSTEEVDYTGYRDISTGVRTPSDYRRGGDNEESITKRIESEPNDRQTTTDESMKEIEEILTAEEVLYTVKEGDTRSNILMENVWLSSLKNEDFAKKAVFSTLAKNPQIKLIKQVKKGTSTASFPNLQSKLYPGDIIKIRMPATRDSIRKMISINTAVIWDPVPESERARFKYKLSITDNEPIASILTRFLSWPEVWYRTKDGQKRINDDNIKTFERLVKKFCTIKKNGKLYYFHQNVDIHENIVWGANRRKGETIFIDLAGIRKYLQSWPIARKTFERNGLHSKPTNLTDAQDSLVLYDHKGLIITKPQAKYSNNGATYCAQTCRNLFKDMAGLDIPRWDAVDAINYVYTSKKCMAGNLSGKKFSADVVKKWQKNGPQECNCEAYRGTLDGRTTSYPYKHPRRRNLLFWEWGLTAKEIIDARNKLGDALKCEINFMQIFMNDHVAAGFYDKRYWWLIIDPYLSSSLVIIPLEEYIKIRQSTKDNSHAQILKVNFFQAQNAPVLGKIGENRLDLLK